MFWGERGRGYSRAQVLVTEMETWFKEHPWSIRGLMAAATSPAEHSCNCLMHRGRQLMQALAPDQQ